ncbi:MAG TPA: hypothetical protein DCZ94_04970 [Lentisphaeria bacterium]|nr:MAG: hypothetical protein A2X48_07840 [Lentisphaerae bacterium GWF2_49_21]HBC86289.1 hypothetical protein [Lentisphaeria bacterium]
MGKANTFKMMSAMFLLTVSVAFSNGGEADTKSYVELDQGIVKAYNNNPRNTAEVYANAMLILEKALKEEGGNGEAWQLKARKLITVSCYYECTQSIDKKLYRQAYVWAKRGEKNGTSLGKVGEVPVKNLYDYMAFAMNELKEIPVVKNSKPEELSMQNKNEQQSKKLYFSDCASIFGFHRNQD